MRLKIKSWGKWLLVLLVVGIVGVTASRVMLERKTKQALTTAPKENPVVELAASDVVKAQMIDITQGLALSGTLKAVNSAVVKARVAGELQGLTLREGDFVKAGQVIARIDASELQSRVRQAREQAESSKAQVDMAQRQYDNNKALVDQGFISKTALDTSLANLNAAQSTYKAALAGADVAKKSVDDTVLKAPISGQISQRLAQTGERVGVDTRIVEIVDLSRLELEATLSAADSTQIQVGQIAQLQIEGSPKPVAAKVARINPTAQAGSRSVLTYLSIDSTPGVPLRQGLFAQGTLGTSRASLLAVPLASVRTDKPAPYVQAIENAQVVYKTVELGARGSADGVDVVAVKGLADSAVVLRGNVGSLREGTPVKFTAMTGSSAAASSAKLSP
ncbi:MAG: efflux RND transporter periplasmic adaptor subunit [Polaromonas sp.]